MPALLIATGTLMALAGSFLAWQGWGIVVVERGWVQVIAGTTLATGGALVLAMGLVWRDLRRLFASRPQAEPAPAAFVPSRVEPTSESSIPAAPVLAGAAAVAVVAAETGGAEDSGSTRDWRSFAPKTETEADISSVAMPEAVAESRGAGSDAALGALEDLLQANRPSPEPDPRPGDAPPLEAARAVPDADPDPLSAVILPSWTAPAAAPFPEPERVIPPAQDPIVMDRIVGSPAPEVPAPLPIMEPAPSPEPEPAGLVERILKRGRGRSSKADKNAVAAEAPALGAAAAAVEATPGDSASPATSEPAPSDPFAASAYGTEPFAVPTGRADDPLAALSSLAGQAEPSPVRFDSPSERPVDLDDLARLVQVASTPDEPEPAAPILDLEPASSEATGEAAPAVAGDEARPSAYGSAPEPVQEAEPVEREPVLAPRAPSGPITIEGEAEPATADIPYVVKTYTSGGHTYMMFSDGTIEADTPEGLFRFGSIEELKAYIASQVPADAG